MNWRVHTTKAPIFRKLTTVCTTALATCLANGASAQGAPSAPSAPAVAPAQSPAATSPDPVTPYVHARYRLESVDQDGIAESATASTMRVRVGLRTATWHGLSALVEGEAIIRLGPEDYNDTVNGRAAFPVVADPSDIHLNQAFIRWQPAQQLELTGGRQAINLDNQRWVGSVDWRQNDQTLDAVRAAVSPARNTRIEYIHSWRVNRVFGPDSPQGVWRDSDIHLLRGSATLAPVGTITAYGYWLDLPAAPSLSSRTLGLRLNGQQTVRPGVTFHYTAEFARQRDHGVNPASFSHNYLLIEPGLGIGPVTARVGFERLSGDGATALQTPLATLHAFNGWTDRFLSTPANGLRDLYADVQWRLGPVLTSAPATLRLQAHDFNATRTSADYGREFGAWLIVPVSRQISASVKMSHYDADAFATDTTKFWFSVEARF
ncbi:MAG: hypothetical protein E6R00_08140 [Gammaproteobacteria bacterium]|nr:MAG: hypothetical protein E6R00_08140 [Gammaproteobacteria bacterium]